MNPFDDDFNELILNDNTIQYDNRYIDSNLY